jgi:protocatechuate 3,4-dioxygenase beta subunit
MRKPAILLAVALAAVSNAFAAITGTVIDPDGKPIAGATLRAYAVESSAALRARAVAGKIDREPLATAQSSENGAFSIDVKGAAAVDIEIAAPARNHSMMPSADGDDLGAIILAAPPTRMLRVTSGGKPVANAVVLSGMEAWRTNASGEAPAPATTAVFVVHPDYAVARREWGNGLDVKLTRGVAVRGRVVNAAGPVPHAIVSINAWPLAETGEDGTFAIAHAPENWQSISALRGSEVGSANRSKSSSVEIRLAPGATFTGTLRDPKKNAAVAGARMILSGADDFSMTAVTDAKGNVTFAPLLPHTYQVGGMHPAFAVETAGVTLPATKTRSFMAQPFARAKGRVIDDERKPVGAAIVTASGNSGVRGRASLTNAAGEFAVRVVAAPAPLPIFASKRDYVSGTSAARLWQPGETRDDVVITLAHGFVAQVRVIDKQRQPVANAQINLTRVSNEGGPRTVLVGCADPSRADCRRTGADGIVSLRTVDGRHDLIVTGDDVAPLRLPNQVLTARAPQITVSVDRGVEISGRVVHADGSPVAGAIVDTPTAMMPRTATSAADGTFTIAGVASGSAVVTAHSSDGNLSSSSVTVNAPARDVTVTMPQGARVEGRILDRATQQPVTDFTVSLPPRNRRPPTVSPIATASGQQVHADDGHYAVENVPPGSVELLVRATGYVPGSRSDINVEDGKTVTGIDIQLDRGSTVSGRVTSGGTPVAGVQVRQSFQRTPTVSNATTDADGFYSLDGVAEGDHTIDFQKIGFVASHKPIAVTAGKDVHLDVELDHGRELRGRVVDRTGRGVAGVGIAATVPGQPGPGNTMMATDADGSFLIQGLTDGKYKVVARKEGFVSAEANDVDVPQNRALTLTMESGATITGHINGLPPEQLTQVIVTASGGTSRNQTYADAGGNFSLAGLPDGRVRVDAILTLPASRRMAPSKSITIENGVAPLVEINFEEGITVSGRVTKAGAPVSGGNIIFVPSAPSPDRQVASAMLSPDGTYTAAGLIAGNYNVRINGPSLSYQTTYTAAASGTFDVDIHGATLRGRVVDATSGAGLPDARIMALSRGSGTGMATTDSDGRFVIDALADATYDLRVTREQYAAVKQQVVVASGTTPEVNVRMEQANAVTIHLLDVTTGAPLDGSVVITDASRAFLGEAQRVDTGTFKAWLKAGTYDAGASAHGYIFKSQSFTTPGEVNIALTRGGTLFIRARTTQTVRLDRAAGGTQRALGTLHPGPNGPYESIPAGTYILATVGSDGKVQSSVPVTITAGETATVDLP